MIQPYSKHIYMKRIYYLLLLAFISFNCERNAPDPVSVLPTVTTTAASSITATTALSGGNITDGGGYPITARGVCWGTTPGPIINGNNTVQTGGTGVFTSNITGLTANTTYYVRAYATNNAGTTFGNELVFTTTSSTTALPTVTTAAITAITTTNATGGGNVTADGGAAVTARGVCWSNLPNPVATGNHTTDGSGLGIFASAITGLTAGITYHVRAYATNSVGTVYGGDSVFVATATAGLPNLTTTAVTAIANTTATSGGNITADGGNPVTARGVCWATTVNPTIALSTKTNDGTGIGTFTSAITGLTAATIYHVRAYATNSVGTAYGNDVTFTTSSSTPDVYVAGVVYSGSGGNGVATVWKNGVATSLTNGANEAEAYAVYVSGTDVYVGGYESNAGIYEPKIWKNGVPSTLTHGCGGDVSGIFVSGADVYAVGEGNFCSPNAVATVWKNNVATSLTNGVNDAISSSVFVLGTDVYVAGNENNVATLWKNGVVTNLSNIVNSAYANSVYVSGTNVYVAFNEGGPGNYNAKLWKNGVVTNLTTGLSPSDATGVYVSGTDVYVSGADPVGPSGGNGIAKLWKNGVATSLTNGTNDATAQAVFVFGTDVYAAGYEFNVGQYEPKFWKNGVITSLVSGGFGGFAFSIFVK
jgi:hypothetical protein